MLKENNFLKKIIKIFTPYFIKNLYVSYVFSLKDKKYCFHYNLLSKLFLTQLIVLRLIMVDIF